MDAGLDSLSGQEMKSQIEEEFEVELPVTAAFDFPSVAALADYVFGEVGSNSCAEEVAEENDSGMTIAHVKARVQEITSSVIGRDVEENEPLMDAGLDSLSGQEMKQRIEDEFEIDLPPTAAFDFPTVRDLAAFVADEIGAVTVTKKRSYPTTVAAAPPARAVVIRNFDIVALRPPTQTVFAAFRFIGGTTTFIRRQCKSITLIARSVTICTLHPSADLFQIISSLIHTPSGFLRSKLSTWTYSSDHCWRGLCNQSPVVLIHTATLSMPRHHVLEFMWESRPAITLTKCCVGNDEHALHPYLVSGTSLNVAAGRISYVFNFRGPSVSVDTACSSSIVTTHTAASGMKSGEMAALLWWSAGHS